MGLQGYPFTLVLRPRADGKDRCVDFVVHEKIALALDIDMVRLHLLRRWLCASLQGTWRLRFALSDVLRAGHCCLGYMQLVVGHVVNQFGIRRAALPVLSEAYPFIGEQAPS